MYFLHLAISLLLSPVFIVFLALVVVVPFADRFIVLAYHAGFGVLFVLFL